MMNEKKPEVLTEAQARGEIVHREVERQMIEPKCKWCGDFGLIWVSGDEAEPCPCEEKP